VVEEVVEVETWRWVVVLGDLENLQVQLLDVIQISISLCFCFTSSAQGYPITVGGGGAGFRDGCLHQILMVKALQVQIQLFHQLYQQVVVEDRQIVFLLD
jgi:hypothetical protein